MCGRFAIHSPASLLVDRFSATVHGDALAPRYNAAPMQTLPVIRFNPEAKERRLSPLRWGLVPVWSKDPTGAAKMINARAEGVAERPAFRSAFKKRRCLVPFDAYYEWRKLAGAKIPHAIATDSNGPDAFAGLWEGWKDPATGEWLHTFTIITTEANDATRDIHDRMPVILPPDRWSAWLGEEEASPDELRAMLVSYPGAHMRVWQVSKDVGSVRNDRPDLIYAVESGQAINPA